ncbi:PIN-domain ribonuclease toxin [Synechococcus sp. RS9909]|uniref:type II toxin-antitoxin system VapC family toxin n=1 Tax=unclassified Synechococcus TaxID=2626047 RepID=UPI00006907C1|nr:MULTISPECIES: type II toxin-antitoxin system VapC family toxin [unclassified Synechococcus]EAQ70465.1 PilT protein, N-terminal [Synechococcus sp. RS9917]QNI80663.1 PIN-domain ribonuclease toxin [Synechococcus sp. RS9909]
MILLDTHVLIWWANGEHDRLSAAAIAAIEAEEQQRLVSAISCWEVAMLVERGRLGLNVDMERWLNLVASVPRLKLLPLSPAVAVASTRLPRTFHADPADRFLVAQARHLNIALVTADSKIRAYPHVRSLW